MGRNLMNLIACPAAFRGAHALLSADAIRIGEADRTVLNAVQRYLASGSSDVAIRRQIQAVNHLLQPRPAGGDEYVPAGELATGLAALEQKRPDWYRSMIFALFTTDGGQGEAKGMRERHELLRAYRGIRHGGGMEAGENADYVVDAALRNPEMFASLVTAVSENARFDSYRDDTLFVVLLSPYGKQGSRKPLDQRIGLWRHLLTALPRIRNRRIRESIWKAMIMEANSDLPEEIRRVIRDRLEPLLNKKAPTAGELRLLTRAACGIFGADWDIRYLQKYLDLTLNGNERIQTEDPATSAAVMVDCAPKDELEAVADLLQKSMRLMASSKRPPDGVLMASFALQTARHFRDDPLRARSLLKRAFPEDRYGLARSHIIPFKISLRSRIEGMADRMKPPIPPIQALRLFTAVPGYEDLAEGTSPPIDVRSQGIPAGEGIRLAGIPEADLLRAEGISSDLMRKIVGLPCLPTFFLAPLVTMAIRGIALEFHRSPVPVKTQAAGHSSREVFAIQLGSAGKGDHLLSAAEAVAYARRDPSTPTPRPYHEHPLSGFLFSPESPDGRGYIYLRRRLYAMPDDFPFSRFEDEMIGTVMKSSGQITWSGDLQSELLSGMPARKRPVFVWLGSLGEIPAGKSANVIARFEGDKEDLLLIDHIQT